MKKKMAGEQDPNGEPAFVVRYDAESIAAMALKVKAEGFVPAEDLKAEFGPEKFTRGIAVLYSDFRMFRKVTRPWKDGQDVVGYEWADRRFSKSEVKKIPPELGFLVALVSPAAPKYSDFEVVRVECRWLTDVLGGHPLKDTDGSPINSFERDFAGRVIVQRYNQRAMITEGMPVIGKEQAIARRIGFETISLDVETDLIVTPGVEPTLTPAFFKRDLPVNDKGQGKGFVRHERIRAGATFTIVATVPTSMLSIAEFLRALTWAGKNKGLSPARSAGFGDFEVLRVDDQPVSHDEAAA